MFEAGVLAASELGVRVKSAPAPLLEGVSLRAEPGQVCVLAGPNGAGKSTLLKVMAGLMRADQGSVTLDGVALARMDAATLARRRAYMATVASRGFNFSVLEYVYMGRFAWEAKRRQERAQALLALERVELEGLAKRGLARLSAGELRRAQLARQLYGGAPWWLMDEPMSHLDMRHQLLVAQLIEEHRQRGGAVLMALHQLEWIARLADQVALLKGGRLVEVGAAEQTLRAARLTELYGVELVEVEGPRGKLWVATQ